MLAFADMTDSSAIETLVRAFFSAFDSDNVRAGSLDRIGELFAPGATITTLGPETKTETLDEFVQPRRALLCDGVIAGFTEWETRGVTHFVSRDVACRVLRYEKRGLRNGAPFTGAGAKVLTLVRLGGAWKIQSFTWQDDSPTGGITQAGGADA